jgi:hypothetical protein
MQLEMMALRHQLAVYQRSARRPRLKAGDRLLWAWLSPLWTGWQKVLIFVQPRTVITWQRRRFRDYWAKLSQGGKPGRPPVSQEVRTLIRQLSTANPLWGSPRIVGELRKLGIEVAKSTVEKYRVRPRKPSSPTWKAFLENHVSEWVAMDFFVVPTVDFKVLFVLVILAHERRRVVHFNVTAHPTEHGSIRRDCLDHVIVLNERHLKRVLSRYFNYYHHWRTHPSLSMDSPESRPVQLPAQGAMIEYPEVGGLHHHYERRAA